MEIEEIFYAVSYLVPFGFSGVSIHSRLGFTCKEAKGIHLQCAVEIWQGRECLKCIGRTVNRCCNWTGRRVWPGPPFYVWTRPSKERKLTRVQPRTEKNPVFLCVNPTKAQCGGEIMQSPKFSLRVDTCDWTQPEPEYHFKIWIWTWPSPSVPDLSGIHNLTFMHQQHKTF